MSQRDEIAGSLLTIVFAGIGKMLALMDWSYAVSWILGVAQQLTSIGAETVAIIVGLPIAINQVKKFYKYIKS